MSEGWKPYDTCECEEDCGVISFKRKKNGHNVGCKCRSCIGKRNQAKGQAAQRKTHQALGGVGFTPSNEESGRPLPVFVMPEVKTGGQVPASFDKFLDTDWFKRALGQSERAMPIGSGVKPSVSIVKGETIWLVVKVK
jgi:hypothetical protein